MAGSVASEVLPSGARAPLADFESEIVRTQPGRSVGAGKLVRTLFLVHTSDAAQGL